MFEVLFGILKMVVVLKTIPNILNKVYYTYKHTLLQPQKLK